jgi:hypothetical protein
MEHVCMKTEIIRRNTVAQFFGLLDRPDENGLWERMGARLDAMKDRLFENQGGSYGRPAFMGISESIIGRPRIGSDGQAYGVYARGMRDILRASGNYLDSFKTLEETSRGMVWGSDHELADRIPYAGGRTTRYVVPDVDDYSTQSELMQVSEQWMQDMAARAEQIATEQVEAL